MAFNSIDYLLFLIAVVISYRVLPYKLGLLVLLGASYFFYSCWNHYYLTLIILSTCIDFFCAQFIERNESKKRIFLCFSLFSNLGLLFIFKYYGFFTEISENLAQFLGGSLSLPSLKVLLPVGISFYTFQTMSYSIDVYQQKIKAERNFLKFALYVSFFPQLVAGPIERAKNILPQLIEKTTPSINDYLEGFQRITWGLFKKVVIADRLALYVDWAFASPEKFSNPTLVLAGFFSSIMLYADFSAYADIAIGSSKCLGIKLSENFKNPFFCRNMPQFWRHWHISLHNWFTDYVYLPLGGNRVGLLKFTLNVFIVFFLSGLWHGASLNFLIWGMFHFLFIMIHLNFVKLLKKQRSFQFPAFLGIIMVNLQWSFSMYFFFIEDLSQTLSIFKQFIYQTWSVKRDILGPHHITGFLLICLFTFILFFVEKLHLSESWTKRFAKMSFLKKSACYYFILFSIFIFGIETNNPFIYFQF